MHFCAAKTGEQLHHNKKPVERSDSEQILSYLSWLTVVGVGKLITMFLVPFASVQKVMSGMGQQSICPLAEGLYHNIAARAILSQLGQVAVGCCSHAREFTGL